MSDISYTLTSLTLAGFRAYLEPREFPLNQKRCLAIFAPNGKGKSGVVDALEFVFSEDGTLARLGIRAINNQAGLLALAHYSASDRNIQPKVTVKFRRGAETLEGTRNASGTSRDRPEAATTVGKHFNVNPLIRGYELRRFVEEQKAEERYTEVANWLQLTPLVEVQKNLRLLRQQVKADAEDSSALTQINTQVSRETSNVMTVWDEPAAIAFANENILAPLDATLWKREWEAMNGVATTGTVTGDFMRTTAFRVVVGGAIWCVFAYGALTIGNQPEGTRAARKLKSLCVHLYIVANVCPVDNLASRLIWQCNIGLSDIESGRPMGELEGVEATPISPRPVRLDGVSHGGKGPVPWTQLGVAADPKTRRWDGAHRGGHGRQTSLRRLRFEDCPSLLTRCFVVNADQFAA